MVEPTTDNRVTQVRILLGQPNLGVYMSDGGKGSNPRPYSVDRKTFDNNWDAIFKKKEEPVCQCKECKCENKKDGNVA